MNGSDDEYQPSQTLGGSFEHGVSPASKKRPHRFEVQQGMKERRISRLFEPGGPLDSQTSESQFIARLEKCGNHGVSHGITDGVMDRGLDGDVDVNADGYVVKVIHGVTGYANIGVQTDAVPEMASPLCPCMLALLSAKQELHDMQAAYAAKAEELQKMHIWMLDNPSLFLDTSEQSQVMMEEPWMSHSSIYSEELGLQATGVGSKRGVEDVVGEAEDVCVRKAPRLYV